VSPAHLAGTGKMPPPPVGSRAASWLVGLAACLLIGVSLGSYVYHRRQLEAIAAGHLRLLVMGPAELHAGAAAQYTVTTSTIAGDPLPAQIELALYLPDGKRLLDQQYRDSADEQGRLQMVVPGDMALPADSRCELQLKVSATRGQKHEEVKTTLPVRPTGCLTRLSLDGLCYRPGQSVRFRSLSLSRLGLSADRPLPVHFEVLDRRGGLVAGSTREATTDHGVAEGSFLLPEHLADGQYAVAVRSPAGSFPEQRQPFWLSRPGPPQRAKEAQSAGDVEGTSRLPDESGAEKTAGSGAARSGRIDVRFYPEGGELVEGVESRVFFTSRDPSGGPVTLRGTIVDHRGDELAAVETISDGRGSFSLLPENGETYRLKITSPAGLSDRPVLPRAAAGRKVVLSAGTGVFQPGAALEFNLRAAGAGLPLVAVAQCRGVTVGQQMLVTSAEKDRPAANPVTIPLDESIGGVIRLTVYDCSGSPPRPVAERLVYRRPTQRLAVHLSEPGGQCSPGEQVSLSLSVTDEKGEPVAAALGLSVVAQPVTAPAEGVAPDLAAYYLLANDLDHPDRLRPADFDLPGGTDTPIALDLLLGTQRARRLAEPPPMVFDNLGDLRARYEENLSEYRAQRTWALNTVIVLSFFGGLGLALLTTMLGLLRIVRRSGLWLPTAVAAVCCVVVSAVSMDPSRLRSVDGVGPPFCPPPAGGSQADSPVSSHEPAGSPQPDQGQSAESESDQPRPAVETLLWQPLLLAGPDGRASLRFRLPPTPGTFVLTADAHGAGRLGSARAILVSRPPKSSNPQPVGQSH
jgi:hypothetical protein